MVFTSRACLRQEQQCLSLAASSASKEIELHFRQMAEIWKGLSRESDATYRFQKVMEKILNPKTT